MREEDPSLSWCTRVAPACLPFFSGAPASLGSRPALWQLPESHSRVRVALRKRVMMALCPEPAQHCHWLQLQWPAREGPHGSFSLEVCRVGKGGHVGVCVHMSMLHMHVIFR